MIELHRRVGCDPPEFLWVPSPLAALELVAAEKLAPRVLAESSYDGPGPRIASRTRDSLQRMRDSVISRLSVSAARNPASADIARTRSADAAIQLGVAPELVVGPAVSRSLRTSLIDGVVPAIRGLCPIVPNCLSWYGQHEVHRVALYDAFRQLGLTRFHDGDLELLDVLGELCRSTGWWWVFDRVCVMADRPIVTETEPTPGGVHGQRRLHCDDGVAIGFADGRGAYVHHGTVLPEWVIRAPTIDRINVERNVEVRRCAIERIGWAHYIRDAGLRLVDRADDPGNPGCRVELYDAPSGWARRERILLAVNGSYERDGHRRRYGLRVPAAIASALDAAAWTYGMNAAQYACLSRRT
ncbi:hypothetical protein SAMN05445060_3813 [Williamsia sterculiae]|uniref:DUF6745 domain-containing protein n=1 Tax=Williamsia sterculiae TaxID=1344003 RepID=A0A1N7HAA6_9NOCA|nr:hypothetical protein SAMN05445060_3813 [Williamsia sterculiae]